MSTAHERYIEKIRKVLRPEDRIGPCKICHKVSTLIIDHDHKTGQIRSLICNKCNGGLGSFEDNVEWLNRAAEYIKYFNDKARFE